MHTYLEIHNQQDALYSCLLMTTDVIISGWKWVANWLADTQKHLKLAPISHQLVCSHVYINLNVVSTLNIYSPLVIHNPLFIYVYLWTISEC